MNEIRILFADSSYMYRSVLVSICIIAESGATSWNKQQMYNLTSCHLPTKFGVSYCFQFTANFDFLQTNIKLRSQILPGSISIPATFALNFALHSTSISLHVISISIPASSFGFNSFYLIHSPTPSISSKKPLQPLDPI